MIIKKYDCRDDFKIECLNNSINLKRKYVILVRYTNTYQAINVSKMNFKKFIEIIDNLDSYKFNNLFVNVNNDLKRVCILYKDNGKLKDINILDIKYKNLLF